ncbi:MAG: GNAT family N-acetyltransferase [Rhizobiales bacterium]|nr:GNAT family N-acetyltransferase [Hyphomicrobiales bacterium]
MIRRASAGDIPALARVWHEGWHQGHAHLTPEIAALRPFSFFKERMEGGDQNCVVAIVKDEIVGFARWEGDGIAQVFVLPAWHGLGVAPLVLAAVEAELKALGHTHIWLQCQMGNSRARAFYEKHGWCVAAELDVTNGTIKGRAPARVWRMEKELS